MPVSVHNPLSQEYENFVSLAVGLQAAPPGRVLVLNGDVIVADGVLQAVLAETAALALGVCFGETDDEALRVEIREGRVVRLGKGLDPLTSAGEFVGVSVLSQAVRARYLERVDTRARHRSPRPLLRGRLQRPLRRGTGDTGGGRRHGLGGDRYPG